MKLEKNSEIFKSISYRYKFLVGARDPWENFLETKMKNSDPTSEEWVAVFHFKSPLLKNEKVVYQSPGGSQSSSGIVRRVAQRSATAETTSA